MNVLVSEHQGVSSMRGKLVKGTLSTSFRGNMLKCGDTVAWEDLAIIGIESNTIY